MRQGRWAYTLPFSIGNFVATPKVGVKFRADSTTVIPVLSQFDVAGTDPSGYRHLTSHASFLQILASGQGPASPAFDDLDLNGIDIASGSGVSNTKCFIFRISEIECSANARINNMKLWVSNTDDFLTSDWKVVSVRHKTWHRNLALPVSYLADSSKWLSTTLPSKQNLYRSDGGKTIWGSGDADVSQYIYVALVASGTLPLGEYGGSTSGFFLRVSYNFDNITDLRD